jgi:hypothetical protein
LRFLQRSPHFEDVVLLVGRRLTLKWLHSGYTFRNFLLQPTDINLYDPLCAAMH